MDRVKMVDYFINKLDDKDFEIHQVRQELEKNNIDEEEIKIIVRLVDNELQRRVITKAANKQSMNVVWIGAILATIGVVITLGTYIGVINMGDHFLITYGPFLGGLSILFTGLARKRN